MPSILAATRKKPDVFGWAVRNERFKLVEEEGEEQELFDLANDPLEQTNLLAGTLNDDVVAEQKLLQKIYSNLHEKQ